MRIVVAVAIAVALTAVPSAAQGPPQPVLQGWGGSVLGTFNLTGLEPGMDRASGFGLEADLRLPGTVLSFVGHVSDTGSASFRGAGPRVMHGIKCALVDGAEKCRLSVFGALPVRGSDVRRNCHGGARREEGRRRRGAAAGAVGSAHRCGPRRGDTSQRRRYRSEVLRPCQTHRFR